MLKELSVEEFLEEHNIKSVKDICMCGHLAKLHYEQDDGSTPCFELGCGCKKLNHPPNVGYSGHKNLYYCLTCKKVYWGRTEANKCCTEID